MFNHLKCNGTLVLPEGERAQLSTAKALWKGVCVSVHSLQLPQAESSTLQSYLVISKLEGVHGVSSGREDEDEGGTGV